MAKKVVRRKTAKRVKTHRKVVRTAHTDNDMLVIVRGWMFVVAFALMLGIGAVAGTFVSRMLNTDVPSVAGVQTAR